MFVRVCVSLLRGTRKGKVNPLHVIEAHGVRGGIAPAHS
jgi:hypothetical protein